MKCDICNNGKDYKNINQHNRMKHPELGKQQGPTDAEIMEAAKLLDMPEHPIVVELRAKVSELEGQLANAGPVSKSLEDIAKILHGEIVKPLSEEHGFNVQEWGSFDPAGYLTIAREIKR